MGRVLTKEVFIDEEDFGICIWTDQKFDVDEEITVARDIVSDDSKASVISKRTYSSTDATPGWTDDARRRWLPGGLRLGVRNSLVTKGSSLAYGK